MRKQLIITGKVQGVWYRDWFIGRARSLGIDGWVRNRADGSVEALIDGPSEMIEEMVRLAYEGSRASRVATVQATDSDTHEPFDGFARRPTA